MVKVFFIISILLINLLFIFKNMKIFTRVQFNRLKAGTYKVYNRDKKIFGKAIVEDNGRYKMFDKKGTELRLFTADIYIYYSEDMAGNNPNVGESVSQTYNEVLAKKAKYKIGVEFERNKYCKDDEISILNAKLYNTGEDCSVNGGEYRTPIIKVNNLLSLYKYFEQTPFLFDDNAINYKCGGHIHLSVPGLTDRQLFDNIKYYRELLKAIYPERAKNTYCKSMDEKEKYSIIYLNTQYKTNEIRIFPGIGNFEDFKNRLRLIDYMINNPLDTQLTLIDKLKEKKLQRILKKFGYNGIKASIIKGTDELNLTLTK